MKITRIERVSFKRKEDNDRPPLWLIGFTDLTTLLLAFFILLFATAVPRAEKWNAASESLRTSFHGDKDVTELRGDSGRQEAEKTWQSQERDPGLNMDYLFSIVKKYVSSDPALSKVTVWHQDDMVILSFGSELSFAPGSTDLSRDGNMILGSLSGFLSKLPNTLEVVGHADTTPIQNDQRFNSNWNLSLARANSVATALTRGGYDADIAIRGRGTTDADSLPSNLSETVKNELARRVDIRLHLLQP